MSETVHLSLRAGPPQGNHAGVSHGHRLSVICLDPCDASATRRVGNWWFLQIVVGVDAGSAVGFWL